MNYGLGFDVCFPNIPIDEEIINVLDGGGDAADEELVEEVANEQINDVEVDRVGF